MHSRVIFLVFVMATVCVESLHFYTQPVIHPARETFHIGQVVNFTCTFTSEEYNNSCLTFANQYISTRVNDTTIATTIGPMTFDNDKSQLVCEAYHEESNLTFMAFRDIHVGYEPDPPSSIECVSHHLETMVCRFPWKRKDDLILNWTIEYKNGGLGYTYHTCNSSRHDEDLYCVLRIHTHQTPVFYPVWNYTFRTTVSNTLGRNVKIFTVEPRLVVKPDPVKAIHLHTLDKDSLNISWSAADRLPIILRYSITVISSFQITKQFHMTKTKWIVVSGITPYSEVLVIVRSRPTEGGFWSNNKTNTLRMPKDNPGTPVLPPGAYSVVSVLSGTRRVRIYWKALPLSRHHGNLTGYIVAVYGDHDLKPSATQDFGTSSVSALLEYTLDNSLKYRITLQAKNDVGDSEVTNDRTLIIPPLYKADVKQISWVDTVVDRSSYTVHWSRGKPARAHLDETTLYWCYAQWNQTQSNHVCLSSIHSKKVNGEVGKVDNLHLNISCPICTWAFGVAKNTNSTYSGIYWSKCRFGKYKAPIVSGFSIAEATLTEVKLQWEPPCLQVDHGGRPEYYQVGVSQADTRCGDNIVRKVRALHRTMRESIPVTSGGNITICLRPFGGGKYGLWVTQSTLLSRGSNTDQLPQYAIAVICAVGGGVLLVLCVIFACRCKKRCLKKIPIEVPHSLKTDVQVAEKEFLVNSYYESGDIVRKSVDTNNAEVEEAKMALLSVKANLIVNEFYQGTSDFNPLASSKQDSFHSDSSCSLETKDIVQYHSSQKQSNSHHFSDDAITLPESTLSGDDESWKANIHIYHISNVDNLSLGVSSKYYSDSESDNRSKAVDDATRERTFSEETANSLDSEDLANNNHDLISVENVTESDFRQVQGDQVPITPEQDSNSSYVKAYTQDDDGIILFKKMHTPKRKVRPEDVPQEKIVHGSNTSEQKMLQMRNFINNHIQTHCQVHREHE